MTEPRRMYQIVGPMYETIMYADGMTISCERWPDDKRKNCRINGRRVSLRRYLEIRDGWKDAPAPQAALISRSSLANTPRRSEG